MPAPLELEVFVDRDEYSRYEEDKNRIMVTVIARGGGPYVDEPVVVELRKARRSRDAAVAVQEIELSGVADTQEQVVEFFLPDLVDQDFIHLARHGKYFVYAYTPDSAVPVSASTEDFHLSVISAKAFRENYIFGIPLTATDIKAPKFQPSEITGVIIEEVSQTHPTGALSLTYTYNENVVAGASSSIGTAPNLVTIELEGALSGASGNSFTVEVRVPSGTSALVASRSGAEIFVDLSVSGGVPVGVDNTLTAIAAALSGLTDVSAAVVGDGSTSLTAAEGPVPFIGGESTYQRYLSWGGGPLVSITRPGQYVLKKGSEGCVGPSANVDSGDYLIVRVTSHLAMPLESKVESILIDRTKMTDETIRSFLCQAIAWVENDFLQTPIEPTVVVTDRDPTTVQWAAGVNAPAPIFTDSDFDQIVSPLTYYVPRNGSWIHVQFPWPQILRVDSLFGAVANTRVIDIDLEWIEPAQQGGLVQLVPFNQEIAFNYIGLIWVNALRGAVEIPNFWHYNAIVGLREVTCDLRELVAKKAAIDLLSVLGAALRPGVGSLSLSRDGVSESVSYTTSAKYGVYTGPIQQYQDWMEREGKRLRARYRGLVMRVL